MIVPEATIDMHKLEDDLETGKEPITVEVSADPKQTVRILYEKWQKQGPRTK